MATHVLVNPNITSESGDTAFLHVSSQPPIDVTFTVHPKPSGPVQQKTLSMNANNFVKSPDLFKMSETKSALIIATTAANAQQPTSAVLRQRLGDHRLAMAVPTLDKVIGTAFEFPLDDLANGAQIFVGNPNPGEAQAMIQYGSPTAPATPFKVPGFNAEKVTLTKTQTAVYVTVTNGVPVVLELMINTPGTDFELTMIPPISVIP